MFAAYSMIPASLMMNGVLVDLLSNDILHFDAPWWNEKMVDSCTLYDKMYFCTGDISYELLGQLFAMQFNKDMAASVGLSEYLTQTYGVETLYDLVESGDWTIDTMMTIAKQFYEDKDGTKTQDDRFGFVTTVVALDAFWAGSNLRYLEQGNDGSIIVSDDMGSTKASDLAAKFVEFMKHPSVSVYSSFAQAINGNGNGVWEFHLWKGNQSLMYLGNLSYVLEEVPFDKGVLPVPKHDQDQEDYLTCSGFPFAMWGIARSATNYDDLCYVLECLASESYRKITPAYFDQALQGRQDTQKDYNMLELIRQSAFIDGGRVMTKAFNEWTYYVFRGALAGPSEYLPYYAEHEEALKEQALALNSLILNMEQLYG